MLQEGRFGYLVPVQDPIALAAGIESALDRPISKKELAAAVQPFSEKTVLQRHFEILGLAAAHEARVRVGLNATCFNDRPSGARQRFIGIYGALIRRCRKSNS